MIGPAALSSAGLDAHSKTRLEEVASQAFCGCIRSAFLKIFSRVATSAPSLG